MWRVQRLRNYSNAVSGPRLAEISIADKPSTWICEGCGVTVLRQRFAIFGGIALVQPAQRRRRSPGAHSSTCIRF
jgi:hypothetical protein